MIKVFSTIILSGLAMMSAAYAQSTQPIQAKVPFAFSVKGATLTPGTYRLTYSNTSGILAVGGVQGTKGGAFVLARPGSSPEASDASAKLVFRCYEKACYLAQVWQGSIGGGRNLELPQPARERKLAFETRVVSITLAGK